VRIGPMLQPFPLHLRKFEGLRRRLPLSKHRAYVLIVLAAALYLTVWDTLRLIRLLAEANIPNPQLARRSIGAGNRRPSCVTARSEVPCNPHRQLPREL
jgi:hypothetical protein